MVMETKRILYIAQYYPPAIGAASNRAELLTQGLARKGMDIRVIAEMPNYPTGKVYKGYHKNRWWFKKERVYPNITVYYVPVFFSNRVSIFGRILNYLTFTISATIRSIFIKNIDLIIATSPPPGSVITGWVNKIFRRKKLFLDIRDIISEIRTVNPNSKFYLHLSKLSDKLILRKGELILTVTDHLAKDITHFTYKRVVTLHNTIDCEKLKKNAINVKRDELEWNGVYSIVYAGNVGLCNGLEYLIDVAKLFKDDKNFLFNIIGEGSALPKLKKRAENLDNIKFCSPVERNRLLGILGCADIVFVTLANGPFMTSAFPTKLLEPLALGKSIIAALPSGKKDERLENIDWVRFVDNNNPNECKKEILRIIEENQNKIDRKSCGEELIQKYFDHKRNVDTLYKLCEEYIDAT